MVLFSLVMILMLIYEVPRMIKRQEYREIVVFFLLWLTSGAYTALFIMGASIPTPMDVLTVVLGRVR